MKKSLAKNSLRIGIVFDDSLDRVDGVQQQIRILGKWLKSEGHHVRYLAGETTISEQNGDKVYSLSKGINVKANQNTLTIPTPVKNSLIKEIMNKEKFDVIHVMLPFSPFLGKRVISYALKTNVPMVGTFHTYPATKIQKIGSYVYGNLIKRTLNKFDSVISVSEPTKQYAKNFFGVDTEVLPNFVEKELFENAKPNLTIKKKIYTVVYVGRLVERKGPQHLIEACNLLNIQGKLNDMVVYICGKGPLQEYLQGKIIEYKLNENVIMTGFITEEEKLEYLASADLACFPATGGEAFGIVLLEAMCAGAVTIGGNNPGYASILNSSPGLLFEPINSNEFADKIYSLLTNSKLRNKALKWQNQTTPQYDIVSIGPKMVDIYRNAIDAN